jgi:hypothetical protein
VLQFEQQSSFMFPQLYLAAATGDKAMAQQRYQEFLAFWKNANPDRAEVTAAKEFLATVAAAAK